MIAKDKIKMILKGILLYTTFIVCIFFIMGIDNIYDNSYFLIDIVLCAGLIFLCKWTISEEEINTILLTKYFNKFLEDDGE